jgi:hypothetical protein
MAKKPSHATVLSLHEVISFYMRHKSCAGECTKKCARHEQIFYMHRQHVDVDIMQLSSLMHVQVMFDLADDKTLKRGWVDSVK